MYADWGCREKAGDERLLPSAVFLSGQQRAQLAANRQRVIVRSLVTDHAVTGQIGTIVVSAGFPAAPFAIAPAAGSNNLVICNTRLTQMRAISFSRLDFPQRRMPEMILPVRYPEMKSDGSGTGLDGVIL